MSKTEMKKSTETTPYDVAEHLRTSQEMAVYVEAWLDVSPNNTAGVAKALGNVARAKEMTER